MEANPLARYQSLTYAGSIVPSMPDREAAPRAEYRRRADRHRERAAEAARLEESISRARLGVGLAAALIAWLVLGAVRLSALWLLVPAAAFAALLVVHARLR